MQELVKIGGLECLHLSSGKDSKGAVVFIHGYGANAYDLAGLAKYIQTKTDMDWYFPNGILEIPFAPGYSGRAWFPISVSGKVQEAVLTGNWSPIANLEPEGLKEAEIVVNKFLDSLPFPYESLILGGFSQGAMLATEIFLNRKELPRSLVLFSGTLLKENIWRKKWEEKKGYKVFQSHGIQDSILPYGAAKRLNDIINSSGVHSELLSFQGGHEIPEIVITKLNSFLA